MAIRDFLLSVGGSFLAVVMLCPREGLAGNINQILPHLHRVYRDDFIEIRSDVAVPNAAALAVRMKEAYGFDARAQGFASAAFKKPYTVGLASLPLAMKYGYGRSGGAALDADTYVCEAVDGAVS